MRASIIAAAFFGFVSTCPSARDTRSRIRGPAAVRGVKSGVALARGANGGLDSYPAHTISSSRGE